MDSPASRASVVSEPRPAPAWLLGLLPLVLLTAAIGAFVVLGAPGLGERRGPPAEALAVERTRLEPGAIELTVRNDGPDAVRIAQVVVNDAFASFTGGTTRSGGSRRRPCASATRGSRARRTRCSS